MNQIHAPRHTAPHSYQRLLSIVVTAFLLLNLAGCATSGHPRDPMEGYNRAMFSFNDTVDKVALKPVATVYQKITPSFVQTAVGNFFGNLGDVWTAVNNLLQGKVNDAATDVTRVAMNSTFGIAGLIDIASEAGLPKHKEDLGQTLGKWGIGAGPYFVLPILGPSTLRDTLALPVDIAADPWGKVYPERVRYVGTALRVVDQRAGLLDATALLEEAALDRYEFVRDGFLQRRENKVYDGEIPRPASSQAGDDQAVEVSKAPVTETDGLPVAASSEVAIPVDAANTVPSDTALAEVKPEQKAEQKTEAAAEIVPVSNVQPAKNQPSKSALKPPAIALDAQK